MRAREQAMLLRAIERRGLATVADIFDHIWRWYTMPRREPYLRLFFEVLGLAIQNPARFPGFLDTVRTDLLSLAEAAMVQAGFPRDAARVRATFYIGALRGLLLDWLATKDRARLDAAADQLAALMQDDLARIRARAAPRPAGAHVRAGRRRA